MTTLWRINISPDAEPGVDAREFCFSQGIIGFGWPIYAGNDTVGWAEYEERATRLYYKAGDRGWWPAINALYHRMKVGALVWSRNWKGVYYLGQVSGEWEYSEKPEHRRADVVNFRRCQWLKVGAADEVPGAVRNSFSRGRVLQAVDSMPALNYSGKLFDELSGKFEYIALYTDHPNDLFALLSHSALEDLVGLYLQSLGYSIVPSTCCRTSAVYEFVLRHREDGRMATVQVKAREGLNRDDYCDIPGRVFLFTASENYAGNEYPHIHCISRQTLAAFANGNRNVLPATITRWLK